MCFTTRFGKILTSRIGKFRQFCWANIKNNARPFKLKYCAPAWQLQKPWCRVGTYNTTWNPYKTIQESGYPHLEPYKLSDDITPLTFKPKYVYNQMYIRTYTGIHFAYASPLLQGILARFNPTLPAELQRFSGQKAWKCSIELPICKLWGVWFGWIL